METHRNLYSPEQPSLSSQRHPLLGLWNPTYQGWLVNDLKEVYADSSIWTKSYAEAQAFRTEEAAMKAMKQLRDFYGINVTVCVLDFNDA